MHQTSKYDLMECLESVVPKSESVPDFDIKIVDGAALVHILDPKKSQVSVKDSLKVQTRMNRGSGNHLRVSNSPNIPVDWKSFLRCDANKGSSSSTEASHLHI